MNELKRWLKQATPEEKASILQDAGTTDGALRQACGGYRSGGELNLSPEFAHRLTEATVKVRRRGLKPLNVGLLAPTCAACKYYKKGKKK